MPEVSSSVGYTKAELLVISFAGLHVEDSQTHTTFDNQWALGEHHFAHHLVLFLYSSLA